MIALASGSRSLWLVFAMAGALVVPTPTSAQGAAGAVAAADRAAILRALSLAADAKGQVENECGEKVTPQFLPAELGGAVGTAVVLAMGGGPNLASCYGDGPGLSLMKREGARWRLIYSSRGGFMSILPTQHGAVRDLAFAGPGFEYPLWIWNGTEYAPAGRSISDAEVAKGTILP